MLDSVSSLLPPIPESVVPPATLKKANTSAIGVIDQYKQRLAESVMFDCPVSTLFCEPMTCWNVLCREHNVLLKSKLLLGFAVELKVFAELLGLTLPSKGMAGVGSPKGSVSSPFKALRRNKGVVSPLHPVDVSITSDLITSPASIAVSTVYVAFPV
jgi:hypothetical protein